METLATREDRLELASRHGWHKFGMGYGIELSTNLYETVKLCEDSFTAIIIWQHQGKNIQMITYSFRYMRLDMTSLSSSVKRTTVTVL